MSEVFLYGPLAHPPLLAEVLGVPADRLSVHPGAAPGHAIADLGVTDAATLVVRSGARAEGILLTGLSEDLMQKLNFYAQAMDLQQKTISVQMGGRDLRAATFIASAPSDPPDWSARAWIADAAPRATRAAAEIIAGRQWYSAAEMAARRTPVLMRAAAWAAARARPGDGDHDIDRDVIVHRHAIPYLNFFSVHEMDLQYRRYDGTMSEVINRGALVLGEAVVVLPYDPVRDTVLLIEQFRAPLFIGGARAPWLWEPVAGLIDPGEDAETAARREAREEAGVTLTRLEPVARAYSSSGSQADYLHFFIGLMDEADLGAGAGLESEGEDTRRRMVGFEALMADIDAQAQMDLPLITLALWLARHRDRLRKLT